MKRKIFLSMLMALAAISCSKQDAGIVADDDKAFCQMSFLAAGSSVKAVHIGDNRIFWQDNDAISICSRIAARNTGLKFTTELDAPSASAVFTGSAPELESYSAVYPYSAVDHWQSNGEPLVYVIVPVAQKAVIGSFDSDAAILAATTSDRNFTFSHVCSYLKFTIGPDSPEVVSVTVSTEGESVAGICYVDMKGDSPVFGHESKKNTSVSISNADDTVLQEGDYYITMFPLTYSAGLTLNVLCRDGSRIIKTLDTEVRMESGRVYEVGTISSEGGTTPFKLLDVYMEEGVAKGIVFYVSADGMTAKIVSLDRTETTVAWSSVGAETLGTSSKNDGAANTATLRSSSEAASIPALTFCDSHGEGWYWPALNELQTLFETYNGTTYSASTNAVPANITEAEKASRAAFDKVLTDNGGTALNTAADTEIGSQYWSSTEQIIGGVAYGSSFRFGKRYDGAGEKYTKTNAGTRYVRCVKVVTK